MLERLRQLLRRFFDDPLGACIESGVYLIMLGVGVYVLVILAKIAYRMVLQAVKS
jgi:hypothetical protein